MKIALIISIFLNVILLITSQDCRNCVAFQMIREKDEKIEMLENFIKGKTK